ncbi:choice-of-anchor I family protein [Nodularia harveyana UHCC-0300]|uniref:Choice-of-anchor I family protein n=1 Tax=Nodularia harveyana UHCC-0300 TaxID=2974287 RepID=A0ABU5UGA0_9CYAN|nr:choice-of-anchor I family protein [Nodularia harveyana]MEA5582530.1 choice-of-anchor I family protein [Nodularia harveyana UHCC-0300]
MIIQKLIACITPSAFLLGIMASPAAAVSLTPIGSYSTGIFDNSAAEIPTYDPVSQRLFVVNAAAKTIDVIGISDPTNPSLLFNIDINTYFSGGNANSVAFNNGILAAAVEAPVTQDLGQALFFNVDGNFLGNVAVGALPDMLTFTPDGQRLLLANEGEPNNDYTIDPEGSVSIVDLDFSNLSNSNVITAGFTQFNSQIDQLRNAGVRIFGPNASVAQDLEPEYITVSPDSRTAWVSLQENNAIGVLDLINNQFTDIIPLGFKDYSLAENGFDASDRNDAINIANAPVLGMYQPDGITSYTVNGKTYIVTANEGDARDYDGFSEEVRLGSNSYQLDPNVFSNADELSLDENLGRLRVTNALGDANGDGLFEEIYAFGGRSFTIWEWDEDARTLNQVYDSADDFEQITAQILPDFFNSSNDETGFDSRSDDKGPEPEDVKIAEIDGRFYAFIGLERVGGVMTYDITDPVNPLFVNYINNRDFTVESTLNGITNPAAGDLGVEGLLFISAADSPNGQPLLVAGNEVSGTTTVFSIQAQSVPEPGSIFGLMVLGSMGILKFKRKH